MKGKRIALSAAVVSISAGCGTAYAQVTGGRSVTLYGILDTNITYTNNQGGHSNWQAGSGGISSSRWGLKGQEDLGGGNSAIFNLENGFNAMTGTSLQNGREFGRLAYVGLSGKRWGQITAGRQNDIIIDYMLPFTASNIFAGAIGAHAGDVDNTYADFKLNNTVKYVSPDIGGFSFSGLYALGGIAGSMGSNQVWGVGAQYARGPVRIGAVYRMANNPAVTIYDGSAGAAAGQSFTNPVSNPIYRGYASARNLSTYAVGGSYVFGVSKLALSWTGTEFRNVIATSSTPGRDANPHINTAEAVYTLQPDAQWLLGVAYAYTFAEDARYQQVTSGVQYFLSKRTMLYGEGAFQHASGTNSLGARAVANLNLITASSTSNQTAIRFGIKHLY
ncbi:porin [Paraburkholderia tropica]|uniref:porin n=1 Tax=Paraburkholderia tropica TaxID=92647 RepID=UPI00301AEDC7